MIYYLKPKTISKKKHQTYKEIKKIIYINIKIIMGNCARVPNSNKDPIIHAPIKKPPSKNYDKSDSTSPNNNNTTNKKPQTGYHSDLGVLNLMSHIGYTNNCKYEGELSSSKQRHGKGVLKWPDGTVYSGSWLADKATGKGLLSFPNGDYYEGDFLENRFEGKGKYTNSKGVTYEGHWIDNLQHGFGVETFSDGTRFEGMYIKGEKNGQGRIYFSDGSVYEGEFVENNIEGFGKLTWPASENKIYEGQWKNNVMEGKGKMTWIDAGKVYEGQYKNDKKNGLGCFIWSSGEKWVGYWKEGNRNGKGVLFSPENKIIEKGEWLAGKKVNDFECEGKFVEGFEEIFSMVLKDH